jgi:16S rRNA G1207 methylase RsmC
VGEDHYFTAAPASADERRVIEVTLAGVPRQVTTAPGVFSPGHIDLGTQVLLGEVPAPQGRLLDLGCGWGPIALSAALVSPEVTVTAVDVNERALDLLRINATALGVADRIVATTPDGVDNQARFDVIWSNPPIRVGKAALHEMLHMWLPRLEVGGVAWLVVQRNLGADSLASWLIEQGWAVTRAASSKGFRVLRVREA